LIINALGAVLCGSVFYALNAVFAFQFMEMGMTMVTVALVNTLYRLVIVLTLSPVTGLIERIVGFLFPERADEAAERADMDRLESRFLTHPALALAQSRAVIDSMAEKALQSVTEAISVRRKYDRAGLKKVNELESMADRYEDKLGSYLVRIISNELKEEQSEEINKYLRVLSDFERISDHARNIGEAAQEIADKRIELSGDADRELSILEDAVRDITALTIDAFVNDDPEKAVRVEPLEEVIDSLCDQLKARHVGRVRRQECTLEHGFVFNDMLTDYERISDHCSNVAIDIIESATGDLNNQLHREQEASFKKSLLECQERYRL
ncbi:MAG: PhoU domain-containing protein, partial [Eubacteriales bacterium]|nr:PhoU domain-containing protein [Eubacteriales bacterium]